MIGDRWTLLSGSGSNVLHHAGRERDRQDIQRMIDLRAHPRGFIFSDEEIDAPDMTDHPLAFGHLRLSSETEAFSVVAADRTSQLILIGYAIDLTAPSQSTDEIAKGLLEVACNQGKDQALDATNDLLGRFCVILYLWGQWFVVNDACATRTVYYAVEEDRFVLSSHSTLVGKIINADSLVHLLPYYRFGLPGFRAPFEGVRVLPPNFCLNAGTAELTRFWPRRHRRETTVDDAFVKLDALLLTAARAISARWRPAHSITAGLDSRVSFAAFRTDRNAVFFTYDRGPIDEVDIDIGRRVCDAYEAAHKRISPRFRQGHEGLYRVLDGLHDHRHVDSICPAYKAHFGDGSWMHVRSNLSEIGRSFWRKGIGSKAFELDLVARLCMDRRREAEEGRPAAEALAREGSAEMIDVLGYDLSNEADPALLGYDAWDLFYWEHRMATWHSQLLLGSDLAFDTAIIFNNRSVLEIMLSVPQPQRLESVLLHRFIEKNAPRLVGIPINPKLPRNLNS
jgi:hypothetical protein